jgi:hypothetical protein
MKKIQTQIFGTKLKWGDQSSMIFFQIFKVYKSMSVNFDFFLFFVEMKFIYSFREVQNTIFIFLRRNFENV